MSPLNIIRRDAETGPVLHVAGALDYQQAASLREQVEALALSAGQSLVIDLSGLEFCDSSGITALLAARRRAHTTGADLALVDVPANTLRILTVAGLDQVFTIRSSTD
ncbi:STAS domain-containing protein [Streptomyces sp. NRRL S-920]|uniref:STAS domain-containing protein n=1 Tax=Streptomyces sp. NRRL S-920 TaxID=1463921 RepID=UPI0004C5A49E|nr:STAS domain-containing protein [Streptomyces sp. NRRL S-920]